MKPAPRKLVIVFILLQSDDYVFTMIKFVSRGQSQRVISLIVTISLMFFYEADMFARETGDATAKPLACTLVHIYLHLPIWCHLTPGL